MTDIQEYIDNLPDNIEMMYMSGKDIYELPDISRFKQLLFLDCSNNRLTRLPNLPENLMYLHCKDNPLGNFDLSFWKGITKLKKYNLKN